LGDEAMRGPQTPKKTETIELRLPHEMKAAFMARCRASGASASEALRGFIADYAEGRTGARRRRRLVTPARAAILAGALLAGAALAQPSMARASLPAAFARIDADHDGKISFEEFSRAASVKVELDTGAGLELAATADERGRLLRQAFDRIDADRDGEISFAEFRRAYGR
jgi:hypothetical protein